MSRTVCAHNKPEESKCDECLEEAEEMHLFDLSTAGMHLPKGYTIVSVRRYEQLLDAEEAYLAMVRARK